jgi:hypothetical protein
MLLVRMEGSEDQDGCHAEEDQNDCEGISQREFACP